MLKVGLTGGIGSGKSLVASKFAQRGIPIIDADAIARELTAKNAPALQDISRQLGSELVNDGELDRRLLADRVFADPVARQWLESLLHPLIRGEIQKRVAALSTPYCIVVIPLLFETGQHDLVDRTLVVDADESLRVDRVRRRDGRSEDVIRKIMSAQANRGTRIAAADDVIVNESDVSSLDGSVESLHRKFLEIGTATSHRP